MRINLQAPINQLGYGVAAINILKALQAKDVEVSFFPIGQPQVTNQADADAVRKGMQVAQTFDPQAPCVKIWHQNQMAERVGSGKFIGFPIFELDTFNDLEKHHLNSCDHLFVCSKWAKEICLDQTRFGEHRVHVVPLGVDSELFPPAPARDPDGKIIFFNCGKWEVRKGHDILIEAFKRVAEEVDNVELWMMTSNPFNTPEENARWYKLYNHPKVKFIPRAETQAEVYNIMTKVDLGIFPSRGEGWNLELLEMMSVGKHVFATDYSAHTEFCTEENCGLIPVVELEPAFDGKWFHGHGKWAKISEYQIDSLARNMKHFAKNYKNDINSAGIETSKKFTWENTANEILESI